MEKNIHSINNFKRCDEKKETIALKNKNGDRLNFRIIFAITLKGVDYCILSPAEEVRGIDRNSALAFVIINNTFKVVQDTKIVNLIFKNYYSSKKGDNYGKENRHNII